MYRSRSSLIASAAALAGLLLIARRTGHGIARPGPEGRAIDDLVTANHILANRGIVDGYGHVSVRSPTEAGRFLLSRAKAPALVIRADVLEYDLDGNAVSGSGGADYRVPMRAMFHMSSFLAGGVPVFDVRDVPDVSHMLVADVRTGQALARTLGDRAVVLMRGHGAVIVAGSLPAVVSRSVYTDLNAKIQARAIALGGTVTSLDAEAPVRSPETADDTPPYDRDWELWKRQAGGR